MNCTSCQQRLSSYLDGELSDSEASALRGHLRTCAACSEQAATEAAVIDTLRQLPSLDPPPALWQAIRGQLAHEEIADAEAPAHRRLWRKLAPWAPRGVGGLAVAAAVALLWWARSAPHADGASAELPQPAARLATELPLATGQAELRAGAVVDVAAALGDELVMIDRSYREAVSELEALIGETRSQWTESYARHYDQRVRVLLAQVDAKTGRGKERAWQALMRFLQTTLTRAELAMGEP